MPIILSHTLPIWDKWGGLKIQEHLFSIRNPLTVGLSTLMAATYKASVLLMKFVPLSERKAVTFLLTAINRLKTLIKVDDDTSSISSRWTARLVRQVNKIAKLFLFTDTCTNFPGSKGVRSHVSKFKSHSGKFPIFCST